MVHAYLEIIWEVVVLAARRWLCWNRCSLVGGRGLGVRRVV